MNQHRLGLTLIDRLVCRLELNQVELGRGCGSHQPEELVEGIGHQIPRWASFKNETIFRPGVSTTANSLASLIEIDFATGLRQ